MSNSWIPFSKLGFKLLRYAVMLPLMAMCLVLLAPLLSGVGVRTLQVIGRLTMSVTGPLSQDQDAIQPMSLLVGFVVASVATRCVYDMSFSVCLAVGSFARRVSFQCLLRQRGCSLCLTRTVLCCCWPLAESMWLQSIRNQLLVHFGNRPPRRMGLGRLLWMLAQTFMLLVAAPMAVGCIFLLALNKGNWLAVLVFLPGGHSSPELEHLRE